MDNIRPWEWDWSALAAFTAAGVVFIGTFVTYLSNRHAQRSSAKIELLVLSEKWAEAVREHSATILLMWSSEVRKEATTREQLLAKQKTLKEVRSAFSRLSLLLPRGHPKTVEILSITEEVGDELGQNSQADFIRAIQEIIELRQKHILES